MGREIMRVPLSYSFPIGEGAPDAIYLAHCVSCPKEDHDECEYPYWRELIPKGDGWQLWQTVSDGPVSPVFATPEELIDWMCQPDTSERAARRGAYPDMPWAQGWRREVAEPFVRRQLSSPSMVIENGKLIDGATFTVKHTEKTHA